MSERERDPEGGEPAPELERALERLSAPGARPEFAERLRREFVSGEIERRSPVLAAHSRARRWIPWAIAAGILLVVLPFFLLDPGWKPVWLVVDPDVDTSRRIDTSDEPVRVRLGDRFVLELSKRGSLSVEITRSETPGSPGSIRLGLERGSLAVVTSPGFEGSRLEVQTEQALVAVTGTAFAVDVVPGMGTCVCCYAGSIEVCMRLGEASPARVRAGGNAFAFTDGRLQTGEPVPEHLAPIEGLLPLR